MKEEVAFELSDFMINSGIIGLIKMLKFDEDNSQGHYRFEKETLFVDKDYLLETDLTDLFMKTLINEEENTGRYPRIVDDLKTLLKSPWDKDEVKKLTNTLKILDNNSYKNAYEMLKEKHSYEVDLFHLIKELKVTKEEETKRVLLEQIISILEDEEVKLYLFFREIAYSRIKNFWDGYSFLNKILARKDMKNVHYEAFEEKFKDYLTSTAKKISLCEECGDAIATKEKCGYSYLKGATADIGRKKNDFWNYQVNSWVCPKCAFLFSLMPLGFLKYQSQYLFININRSVEELKKVNSENTKGHEENWSKINQEILLDFVRNTTRALENIEVIEAGVENEDRYLIHLIKRESLEIMKECENDLVSLGKVPKVKVDKEYKNVFDEVMNNIIRLKDNYSLLQFLLKQTISENYSTYSSWLVLKVQNIISSKRKGVKEMTNKDLDIMRSLGRQLQQAIFTAKQTRDRKVLHSLTYKLLNASRIGDVDAFMNIVLRTCASYEAPVPVLLMKALENHDNFYDLAYAYIIGIEYTREEKEGEN